MKKSWHLTQKILTGEKTIETRWYKNRVKPWNCVRVGETVYFKDSGEPVTVKATVSKVEQFDDLDDSKIAKLLAKYGQQNLGTIEILQEICDYVKGKKYAIIIHLAQPKEVVPFEIDKTGFGAMSAWLCIESLNDILMKSSDDK